MGRWGITAVLATAVLLTSACDQVGAAVDEAGEVGDRASVCAEALGLADLNPLVDPERLRERARDKERRLRELAEQVGDRDVKASLLTMADSYIEVQKERFDDASVVARWVKRNTERVDALRTACT